MARGHLHLPIDHEDFLRRHWQREPLLIRSALPDFQPPLSADELAGLAMEEALESRIIYQNAPGQWTLECGPFNQADYQRTGAWTLLVQAVDYFIPEVAALRQLVDFLPQWRFDDVMISYASDGGSVGPHFDLYDVFLLQGQGQRLWKLGQRCDSHSALLPDNELSILQDFESHSEYLLDPGDILYIPPKMAHWGIARGDCTTFSLGFRAPRRHDLLARLTDHILEHDINDELMNDPGRALNHQPGKISKEDLQAVRKQVYALLDAEDSSRWFGELISEPRYPIEEAPYSDEQLSQYLQGTITLQQNPASRLAWTDTSGGQICIFGNGFSYETTHEHRALIMALCGQQSVTLHLDGKDKEQALTQFLLTTGCCHVI
ncbi:MAG: JmjC domain-containing protein [Parahaliea sp.]